MATPASPTSAAPVRPPDEPVVLRDPRGIKALAHPARLAVITELFNGRRLTATECGEIAGLSASAMSYHLRALEKWGIVRRSEATADGRERPWEAAGSHLLIDSAEPLASAAGEAMLVGKLLDRMRADTLGWISTQDETTAAWYDATVLGSTVLWLTQDEARELGARISALVEQVPRRTDGDAPDGARQVRVSFGVTPVPPAGRPSGVQPAASNEPAAI